MSVTITRNDLQTPPFRVSASDRRTGSIPVKDLLDTLRGKLSKLTIFQERVYNFHDSVSKKLRSTIDETVNSLLQNRVNGPEDTESLYSLVSKVDSTERYVNRKMRIFAVWRDQVLSLCRDAEATKSEIVELSLKYNAALKTVSEFKERDVKTFLKRQKMKDGIVRTQTRIYEKKSTVERILATIYRMCSGMATLSVTTETGDNFDLKEITSRMMELTKGNAFHRFYDAMYKKIKALTGKRTNNAVFDNLDDLINIDDTILVDLLDISERNNDDESAPPVAPTVTRKRKATDPTVTLEDDNEEDESNEDAIMHDADEDDYLGGPSKRPTRDDEELVRQAESSRRLAAKHADDDSFANVLYELITDNETRSSFREILSLVAPNDRVSEFVNAIASLNDPASYVDNIDSYEGR
ncbi:hypothetical protein QAD02_001441 [Eretmocerus hayati]|uniref:Uncharacterized protein n=1 Tax=Eretmocerus hayati TaxID=131215 RepID=A0ACC2NIV7_9HYME|nr:hypothetical protein QAD02_001441 [Eretmocerus hayati]